LPKRCAKTEKYSEKLAESIDFQSTLDHNVSRVGI